MIETMNSTTLIGTAEAAARLHVDRSTLTRWVRAGRITPALEVPGYRGAYLFDAVEIERLAKAGAA